MKRSALCSTLVLFAAACSHKPPPDFAPDPGLLAHIQDIEITTTPAQACPGAVIRAEYQAVIDDGTRVPFLRVYDKKHPPRLHIVFLGLSSPEATGTQDASWATSPNALLSATTGFRLTATLKAKPAITHTVIVPPDYTCMPHAFSFAGAQGGVAQAGDNGPDVTVRIGRGRSRFYDKLLIVGIQVGIQAPYYELYDANTIPPMDFIVVETRGGTGGRGTQGAKGRDGAAGAAGCPGQAGATGGDGGNGAPGAPGGRGGPITIIVPEDEPFLAGLVTARSPGGAGGPGGTGGVAGAGGKGGQGTMGSDQRRCADGPDGPAGKKGDPGPVGYDGRRGPRPEVVTLPGDQVFGAQVPPELDGLMGARRRR